MLSFELVLTSKSNQDFLIHSGAGFETKKCGMSRFHYKEPLIVALWSSVRHLASGSGGPGFESWLCQVDIESLGKALYMHFLTPLMCKKSTWL